MFTYIDGLLSYREKHIGRVTPIDLDILYDLLSSVKLEELPELDIRVYDTESKAFKDFEKQWRKNKNIRLDSDLCAKLGITLVVYSIAGCSWYLTNLVRLNSGYPLYQLQLLGEFSRSQNISEGWDAFIASLDACRVKG